VKKSAEARGKIEMGAGATPPFDAPCVTVAGGVAPAPDHACSVMCFGHVPESEEVFCKAHALHLVVRRIGGHDPNRKRPAQTEVCW